MGSLIAWARRLICGARCAIIMLPWVVQLFLADVLLSALLPLSGIFPTLAYHAASCIAFSVWLGIQFIFTRVNRAKIIVSGVDQLPRHESAIVVSNHLEWTDFYMIQEVALRCGMLGRCRWFAKQQLKWVPFLGWGLWAMGMPLVSRQWTADQREMDRVFHGILQRQWPTWLISYSEATRFTKSKRLEAEKWCRANARPLAAHLLYPRTKGFVACVQNLRGAPHVRAVYDFTIAYAKGNEMFQVPPSFLETLMEPHLDRDRRFYVHVDRHDIEDLPHSSEELAQWLEDRWLEKGQRLEQLRAQLVKGSPWTAEGT